MSSVFAVTSELNLYQVYSKSIDKRKKKCKDKLNSDKKNIH